LRHYISLLEQRRTIRKLTGGEIEPGLLADLTQAIALTPAAFNRPPWRVVVIHEERHRFWNTVDQAFRGKLEGERLERYLQRLDQFRSGLGAILIYEDRRVAPDLQVEQQLSAETSAAFVQQALGMLQLSLWLTLTNHGFGTSLQHWDWLIEHELPVHTGLPVEHFALVVVMPFGLPDDEPKSSTRTSQSELVAIDAPFRLTDI
jgi:predicted oxidoreductase (fatty acid repression mutant protein)